MKYFISALSACLLLGAGCWAPPLSVQSPEPVNSGMTSRDNEAYEAAYVDATATRKACGLGAGSYFLYSDPQGVTQLVYRADEGDYKIVADKIAAELPMGFRPICGEGQDTIILEPGSKPVLHILVATGKDVMQLTQFDLQKKVFPSIDNADSSIEAAYAPLNFKIAPTEDELLYIEDAPDYGRSLSIVDLETGKKKIFGTLPHEYSYTRTTYPPNLMGEGLRSKGDVSWIDSKTVKASIYPYAADPPCETCGQKPLKAVKSITVRTDQKEVAP